MSSAEPDLSPQILRIPRSDDTESYVLLHVVRSGSIALDLDVTATEGEIPYTGTVRQAHLKNLRAKGYRGSDEEWSQVLSCVFGQLKQPTGGLNWLSGVESSASIIESSDHGKELVITIRKRIQAITQRLGSVTLVQNDEQAIQLFDWSSLAIAKAETIEQRFSSLLDRHSAAEETIKQLTKQIDDFISAKSQHEEQLMANFVHLLNEKKLKIRNQHRLLASAKVDPENLSELQAAILNQHQARNKTKSSAKRSVGEAVESESGSEDGFEKMEVDKTGHQRRSREEGKQLEDEELSTPQPLEEAGNTTTDEEDSSESPAPSIKHGTVRGGQGSDPKKPSDRPAAKDPAAPPPRRELPFTRRTQASKVASADDKAEETAGETDDDEL